MVFDVVGKESHCGSFLLREHTAPPVSSSPRRYVRLRIGANMLNPGVVPAGGENVAMEQGTLRRINADRIRSETQIPSVMTYIRHVTARRSKDEAGVVKDCTATRFCLMDLCKWTDWPPLAIDPFDGLSIVAAPPGGRMHRLLTTLGRGFQGTIGWKRLGIAASLLIIASRSRRLVRTPQASTPA